MTAPDDCPGVGAPVAGRWGESTTCPECGQSVRVRKSGDIGTHKSRGAQCRRNIEGPRVGRNVVLWRQQCRNRTSDPSGLCHVHR